MCAYLRSWQGPVKKFSTARSRFCGIIGRMPTPRDELFRLHASVCKGLADPKRLLLIDALRDGEMAVGELCDATGIVQANASQHLAILRDKGLVKSRRDGQRVYYSLASPKIIVAVDLLRDVMSEQSAASASA